MGRSGERWLSEADARPSRADDDQPAGYRYGVVLLLVSVLVVFAIVAPDTDWSRALGFALEGAGLVVVLATSRARGETRRTRALAAGIVASFVVIAIAAGALPVGLTFLLSAVLAAAIPFALIGGLLRLVRSRGATDQAVAGALAIYLLVGLLFAFVIGWVSHLNGTPYFVERTGVTMGDRVYFSFATLTTTGYGDFTAATSLGHALAVVEALVGQFYLVTVVAILVGNLARR